MRLTVILALACAASCITGTQLPAGDGSGSDGEVDDGAKDGQRHDEKQVPPNDSAPRLDGLLHEGPVHFDAEPPLDLPPQDSFLCECHGTTQTVTCGECHEGTKTCEGCYYGECVGQGCKPTNTRSCGPCGKGTETCTSSCTWGSCSGAGCNPGSTQNCSNDCGVKTCSGSCTWGVCSKADEYKNPSGDMCWSSNHCATGQGKCVPCYLKCDNNGNLVKDGWCASICTNCAGHVDQC